MIQAQEPNIYRHYVESTSKRDGRTSYFYVSSLHATIQKHLIYMLEKQTPKLQFDEDVIKGYYALYV